MIGTIAALLLVLLLGACVRRALLGRIHDGGERWLSFGEGYLLGVLLLGNALWFAGDIATEGLLLRALPWVAAVLVACVGVSLATRSLAPFANGSQLPVDQRQRRTILVAAGLLAVFVVAITLQAVLLPTLTWDAWNAWLGKAKAWWFAGRFVPVLELDAWLRDPRADAVSVVAAPYPEAIPRFATFLASSAGRWSDGLIGSAWALLWVALGAQLAGAVRRQGCRWDVAAVAALFVLTLPMVTAHASLAGYVDLWLAAVLLAAGHHAALAVESRNPRSLAAALLFAGLLPTVKTEGAVWCILLLLVLLLWWLPGRLRWGLIAGGALLGLLSLLLLGAVVVPLPGAGTFRLAWGMLAVPGFGEFELYWRGVGGTTVESLLLLPNWSLLWWLFLPAVVVGGRILVRSKSAAMLGAFMLLAALFLSVLFLLTDASAWAENLTSLNRLVMHAVPLLVYWLVLLLSRSIGSPAVRGRWS